MSSPDLPCAAFPTDALGTEVMLLEWNTTQVGLLLTMGDESLVDLVASIKKYPLVI